MASHTQTTDAATHGAGDAVMSADTVGAADAAVAHGADAAHDAGGLVFHPLDQFLVRPIFGEGGIFHPTMPVPEIHWYTPSNVTLWLALAVLCVVLLFVVGSRGRATIPTRTQSVAELFYGFTHKMVEDVCGKEGLKYFPYVMTLFVFILFANFLGLIPLSFAAIFGGTLTLVAIALVIATFLAVLAYGSLPLLRMGEFQSSPALRVPMKYVYICLPFGAGYMALELLLTVIQRWDNPFPPPEPDAEEAI